MDPARERLSKGHTDTPALTREQRRAHGWTYDPQLEHLKRLTDGGQRISPTLRIRLGHYFTTKTAAEAAGIDTSPPAAA